MNKINITIKAEIIRAIEELRKQDESKNKSKTNQQKELDDWFWSKTDPQSQQLADLVKILTGYHPSGSGIHRKFQVLTRGGISWVVLKNNFGFGSLITGAFQIHASDRVATDEEATRFIESLRNLDAKQFVTWLGTYLGQDFIINL
jgi:hypothetical protein